MTHPGLVALLLALAPVPWFAGSASAQESFGRLFYTPAQRAQLDAARRLPPVPERAPEVDRPPPAGAPQTLSIEGIVRRNDGRTTVWVNRTPTAAPQTQGSVRIGPIRDPADGADLRLPDSGRRARVKVGQEIDVSSGKVQERYRLPQATGPDLTPTPAPASTGAPPAPPSQGQATHSDAAPAAGSPAAARPQDGTESGRSSAAREAAIDRVLRELGRRLDEPARSQDAVR